MNTVPLIVYYKWIAQIGLLKFRHLSLDSGIKIHFKLNSIFSFCKSYTNKFAISIFIIVDIENFIP